MVPESGNNAPDRSFRVVLFPDPFGPMRPTTVPGDRENVASLRATNRPKDFRTLSKSKVIDIDMIRFGGIGV
jgi:hypothetical protein